MPPRFYYTNAKNQAVGPVEAAEVAWLADTGIIGEETRIIAEGEKSWYSYRRWHQEFRGSVRLPKPLSAAGSAPVKTRKWPRLVLGTAVAGLLASGGAWIAKKTWLDRPDQQAVTDFVAASLGHRGLRINSFQSETKRVDSDRVQIYYRAMVVTASPLYTTIDTSEYLRAHFGPAAIGLAAPTAARAPVSPLAITVLKPATPAGLSLTIAGKLLGTRSAAGWRLAEEPDRQFASATLSGEPRRNIPGQTFVLGDPDDESALKSFVEQATAPIPAKFESPIAAASPARPVHSGAPNIIVFTVPANVRWVDTGIDLEFGESVSFRADGVVSSGPRSSAMAVNETPDGEPLLISSELIRSLVAPLLPAWSLIGKVGDSVPFEVGSFATLHSPNEGRLYLSVNAPSFENRTGVWQVTLTLPEATTAAAHSSP
ncbi:MAG TPA: hypothetical protein VGL42_04605 [Opitutaceae bacterium]|jgi:hypothetical protein